MTTNTGEGYIDIEKIVAVLDPLRLPLQPGYAYPVGPESKSVLMLDRHIGFYVYALETPKEVMQLIKEVCNAPVISS